jgi:hypothetical protein
VPVFTSCLARGCGHWADDDEQSGHCGLIR